MNDDQAYAPSEAARAVLEAYDAERNMRPALEQLREALHGCRVRAIEELGAMARGEDVPAWRCPDCKCVNLEHKAFCYRCGGLGEDDEDAWRDYDHGFRDGYQAALRERPNRSQGDMRIAPCGNPDEIPTPGSLPKLPQEAFNLERRPKGGKVDPLVGKVVQLPDPAEALVLSIENEYDDGTTLRYLTGPQAGTLTQRDTFSVREYEVLR